MLSSLVAVLRMGIGAGSLWLGVSLLRDSSLLYGGLLLALERIGAPFKFYEFFIGRFVELHQTLFAYASAISILLLGVSFLTGTLVSLSSLGGAVLLLNFAFATSAGNLPRLALCCAGVVVLLLFGRVGAGLTWGLDGWLTQRLNEKLVLFPLRWSLPRK